MKSSRFGILAALAVVVLGVLGTVLLPSRASADGVGGPWISEDMTSISKKYAAQEAFLSCFARGTVRHDVPSIKTASNPREQPRINKENADSKRLALTRDKALQGKFFNNQKNTNGEVVVGYVGFGGREDGRVNCSDGDFTMEGQSLSILRELGWADGLVAICEMGAKPVNEKGEEIAGKNCMDSDVQYLKPPTYDGVLAAITKKNPGIAANLPGGVKAGGRYYLTQPGHYVTDWYALKSRCNIRDAVEVKSASEPGVKKDGSGNISTDDRLVIHTVNQDGTISYVSYTRDSNIKSMNVYALMDKESDGWGWVPSDCNDLARDMNNNANAYANYLKAYRLNVGPENMKGEAGDTASENNNTGGDIQCAGGALGWIFCPIMSLLSSGIETGADALDGFMRFEPLMGTSQGEAVFSVWRMVVGMANLALVAAFLVVIFSQATSVGLSAYGIKKMLPRIIAAAILINISFYLCAILVDVFNIIGASISGIVQSAIATLPEAAVQKDAPSGFGPYVASLSLLALGVTALAFTTSLAFLLPLALTMLSGLLFILVVLALRHTLALLLIMASPLAFAAMVLPNTDSMFKKWWKALWVTLALYPIIMALAYGSMLVSKILLTATPVDSNGDPEGLVGLLHVGIAMVIPIAWVFALKFIVTWGAGIIGKIGGMVNDRNKGLIDRSKKWADQKRQNTTLGQIMEKRRGAVNTNAQQRGYRRMGKGIVGGAAKFGMSGNTRQLMDTQIEEANEKIHDSRVRYTVADISKRYSAKDRDPGSKQGLVAMAREAQLAATSKDQVTLDALSAHAASGGADEYKLYHELLQGKQPDGEEYKGIGSKYKISDDQQAMLGKSMRYVYATKGGELAPKSPSLMSVLQTGDASKSIDDEMVSEGMIKMYKKVGADKHAAYSSDQAKVAARYATDEVIRELIENPGGKHSLGDSARIAYKAQYDARGLGSSNNNSTPPATPPAAPTAPGDSDSQAPGTPTPPTES